MGKEGSWTKGHQEVIGSNAQSDTGLWKETRYSLGHLTYLPSYAYSHTTPTSTITRQNFAESISFSPCLFLNGRFQLGADRHGSEGDCVACFLSKYRIRVFSDLPTQSLCTYPGFKKEDMDPRVNNYPCHDFKVVT